MYGGSPARTYLSGRVMVRQVQATVNPNHTDVSGECQDRYRVCRLQVQQVTGHADKGSDEVTKLIPRGFVIR